MSYVLELSQALSKAYKLKCIDPELIYSGTHKIFKLSEHNTNLILKLQKKSNCTAYQVFYERKIMQHLLANQVACPSPFEPVSKREQTYSYLGQEYYGILTSEVVGCPYQPENSQAQIRFFGEALFKLHSCNIPNYQNPRTDMLTHYERRLNFKKNINTPHTKNLETLIARLFNNIRAETPILEPYTKTCICHGDAWPGNAVYSQTKCTLLDFEYSRVSNPEFDIATFIWWALDNHLSGKKAALWDSFRLGYGDTLDALINNNTSRLIKSNELRSLIFIHNNILISEELIEHLNSRLNQLTNLLPPHISGSAILDLL